MLSTQIAPKLRDDEIPFYLYDITWLRRAHARAACAPEKSGVVYDVEL